MPLICTWHFPAEQEESSLDAQKRLAREFYDIVEDYPLN
jgi:hypothetical protein